MTKTISTRLSEEEIELLNQIAEEENMDRSGLIRKFLLQQIKEYRIRKMADYYRKGVISLQEAATASLYEMMEYIEREKIRPPIQPAEEIITEIKDSNAIMRDIKKEKIITQLSPIPFPFLLTS